MQMFEDASVPMEKEMGEPSRSDAENVWKTFYWRKVEKNQSSKMQPKKVLMCHFSSLNSFQISKDL